MEGATVPIRYAPHEFDGWRKRHWTLPFEGERFSLVWFSPAEEGGSGGDPGDRYAHAASSKLNKDSKVYVES